MSDRTPEARPPSPCPKCGKALRKWATRVGQGRRDTVYAHADGTECVLERKTESLKRRGREETT